MWRDRGNLVTIVPCLDILAPPPALHDRGARDMAVLAPSLDPEQPTGLLFGEELGL
jgi:hypothetical protein